MIYVIIGVVLGIILAILEIRFNIKVKEILAGVVIGTIFFITITIPEQKEQQEYIQNIETKLNIYEESYDNFVAEDNERQSGK